MDVMNKKFALIAVLATTLALPASGALARGGGGGGHMGGGFGGGHIGGGFGGGHMGGGFSGGHMGGGLGGGHIGGGFAGSHMGSIGGAAAGAFGSASAFHERSGQMGSFRDQRGARFASHGLHHRRFIGGGFGGYDDSCWDWQSTPTGWVCQYPDDY
jgi:hypothetical protein